MGANSSTSMTDIVNKASFDVFTNFSTNLESETNCSSATTQNIFHRK